MHFVMGRIMNGKTVVYEPTRKVLNYRRRTKITNGWLKTVVHILEMDNVIAFIHEDGKIVELSEWSKEDILYSEIEERFFK